MKAKNLMTTDVITVQESASVLEAIRLMLKYPNLYMMTSAYAPKYLPPELIQYMNTRGQDKILFASDHPVLSFERCLREAEELPLREGVLEKYLRGNALSVFDWS